MFPPEVRKLLAPAAGSLLKAFGIPAELIVVQIFPVGPPKPSDEFATPVDMVDPRPVPAP